MKSAFFYLIAASLLSVAAHASTETWTVNGKAFETKAQAIRAVMATGKPTEIIHTRCEILTNKLTFKACPKAKLSTFENAQFTSLKVSE